MDTILGTLDTDINFWVANPNFKSIGLFRTFMENDKSKNKDYSSRVMWAVALCIDMNIENTWRNIPEVEKKGLLAEDLIGDKKFDWDSVQDLLNAYEDRVLSIPEKDLRGYEQKMYARQKFIEGTAYSLDSYDEQGKLLKGTADQLDKMMVGTAKIYQQHEELKAKYEKAKEEGHVRGGRTESASEQGLL
jgi:hypothetical protein